MNNKGILYVVGIGPGDSSYMTQEAKEALEDADKIIGYTTYIALVEKLVPQKKLIASPMKGEVERCKHAVKLVKEGEKVAMVSSGDPGVYGMAGIIYEVAQEEGADIPIKIIPGVTSATASAALLGAPLMHDFAVISLSDLLTQWEVIEKRVELAAQGDFVICLYNPKSKKRVEHIKIAREKILGHRNLETPVGIVRNAHREDESVVITTLGDMLEEDIDMFTTVIIGNSNTKVIQGKMVTPRGYIL